MDSDLLESWGKLLIGLAKAQKQCEQSLKLMSQWSADVSKLANLFVGEQEAKPAKDNHLAPWMQLDKSFLPAFNFYFKLLGFVPAGEHQKALEKHEELKNKCAALEAELASYRMLKGDPGAAGVITRQFQEFAVKQAKQNMNMIDSFSKLLRGAE